MPPAPSWTLPTRALQALGADLQRLWSPGPALAQRMLEDHRGLIGLSLMLLGPFAASLWVWDWANDPVGAQRTVGLRLLFLLLVPTGLLALRVTRPLLMGLLLQGTLVWTLVLFSVLLTRLAGGMSYGASAFVAFHFFGLFILGGLPLLWSLLFAVLMPALPHGLALAGLLPGFAPLSFALLMWPMSGCMLLLYLLGARGALRRLDLEQRLEAASNADPLTGVSNRRHFMPLIDEALQRAECGQLGLAVVMLDIDHFKRINDAHGHAAGDEAIRALAQLCRHNLRAQDRVARMGGEEFALLLPALDAAAALMVAERIRARADALRLELAGGAVIGFTISAGVAAFAPGDDADRLLARADAAMYASKQGGRNRVSGAAAAAAPQPPLRASRSLFQ